MEQTGYKFARDDFNLSDAYHDCKMVFDGITDDESYQKADSGLVFFYANEIIYALKKAMEEETGMEELKREMTREELIAENNRLRDQVKTLEKEFQEICKEMERARLNGMIDGLKFAVRCNGVSGGDVR